MQEFVSFDEFKENNAEFLFSNRIRNLHYDVNLLQLPEYFGIFLAYLNVFPLMGMVELALNIPQRKKAEHSRSCSIRRYHANALVTRV